MFMFQRLQKVVRIDRSGGSHNTQEQPGDSETPPMRTARMSKNGNARLMRKNFEENFNNWVVKCETEFNLWCRPPLNAGKLEEI